MNAKHVLIVDDEPKVAFFLSQGLERSGHDYAVSVAQSGEEALEILEESDVDLLVTDLRMPGINGLELIRWVKASSPGTRTILITAYGNDDVEAEARRLEAYRYITKPFDIGDFTETVEQALGDVAISQPGLTVLSDKTFDAITQHLGNLRQDVGARCIFLADMQGQCLARDGYTEDLAVSTLLALLAGGFATIGELSRQFGEGESSNLNFHKGTRYEIYSSNVGDNLFIALVFDLKEQRGRIGLVWLYAQRAIDDLLATLSSAEMEPGTESVDADFGSAVMTELDTLFGEGDGPALAPRAEPTPDEPPERDQAGSPPSPDEASDVLPAEFLPAEPEEESVRGSGEGEPKDSRGADPDPQAEGRLLNLEEAIEQGLIPQDFGLA